MPIRFYCPFCHQLLGIASRKAGAAIDCPRCRGQVGVPADQAGPVAVAGFPVPPAVGQPERVLQVASGSEIRLSPNQVAFLGLALVCLLVLAFVAGLVVGAQG